MSIDTAGFKFQKPAAAEGRIELSPYEYRKMKERVYDEQGKCCADCGRKVLAVTMGDLHHIKHRKMGGGSHDDSRANLEFLCRTCHAKEHNQ